MLFTQIEVELRRTISERIWVIDNGRRLLDGLVPFALSMGIEGLSKLGTQHVLSGWGFFDATEQFRHDQRLRFAR